MPSFAELKAKAAKAKDAGVDKFQKTKDQNTSVPLKKTNWDPYSGTPPPALPPPRINSRSRPVVERPPLPPPPRRTDIASSSKPTALSRSISSGTSVPGRSSAPPQPLRGGGPPRLPPRTPSSSRSPAPPSRPAAGPTPPPLPSRQPSSGSRSPAAAGRPPPPISRSTRPDLPSSTSLSPVPPPPARVISNQASSTPPPPQRNFAAALSSSSSPRIVPPSLSRAQSHSPAAQDHTENIDWTNLSREDKQAFFRWLDEYFSRSLNTTI